MGDQRVTGMDEPSWPDTRPARRRHSGRRKVVAVNLVGAVVLGAAGYAIALHVNASPSTFSITCPHGRFGTTSVDYTSSAGQSSAREAVHAFAVSGASRSQGLPTSGYSEVIFKTQRPRTVLRYATAPPRRRSPRPSFIASAATSI